MENGYIIFLSFFQFFSDEKIEEICSFNSQRILSFKVSFFIAFLGKKYASIRFSIGIPEMDRAKIKVKRLLIKKEKDHRWKKSKKVKASERIVIKGRKADNLIDIYIYTSSLSNDRDVATHHSGKWSDEKIKFRARLLHKESGRCDFLFVERVF